MKNYSRLGILSGSSGLFEQDVVKTQYNVVDISLIKPGMLWYEDDTFSMLKLPGKRVKAMVELVSDGTIYGDLTVSELFVIKEQYLPWHEAMEFFKNFHYPCQEHEKIVWYEIEQLARVSEDYKNVESALALLFKRCRTEMQWSSTERSNLSAIGLYLCNGLKYITEKVAKGYIRPVIAWKVV